MGDRHGTSVIDPRRRSSRAVRIVLCGMAGLAIGSVWEMCEFLGHTQLDAGIRVGYDDTIGDLAADLAGGILAGLLVPWFVGDRRVVIRDR
jgi:hypothetical protein